jgi:hypothetical protein
MKFGPRAASSRSFSLTPIESGPHAYAIDARLLCQEEVSGQTSLR